MLTWNLLKTNLRILQLEDYSSLRWWSWFRINFAKVQTGVRRSLVWTNRLKGLVLVSGCIWMIAVVLGWSVNWGVGVLVICLGIFIPGIWVGGVNCFFIPADQYLHKKRLHRISNYVGQIQNLEVIGVVGSFGKTSVKEILFSIFDQVAPTLMTAENFNTAGGIYRVLAHELANQKYLVAEMGAYNRGDIKQLARALEVDWGVITGIGAQHLERFGSLTATAEAKGEIIDQVKTRRVLVNWDSQPLRDFIVKGGFEKKVIKVGWQQSQVDFKITKVVNNPDSISFHLLTKLRGYDFTVPLFGKVNVYNTALAASLALSMGLKPQLITKALLMFQPLDHRLNVTKRNQARLIDNTYSSNIVGFEQVMEDLREFEGTKALVTPGLVELGKETGPIHHRIGQMAAVTFNEIILVGKNERTRALIGGLKNVKFRGQYSLIEPGLNLYWQVVENLTKKYDWVLLENDLTDQYY